MEQSTVSCLVLAIYKSNKTKLISLRKPNHLNNFNCFNNQLRLIICGSYGSGKTSIFYNLLLDYCYYDKKYFLDYNCFILVSPSLNQDVYKIIINGLRAGLSREHIIKLFKLQDKVSYVETAIKTI